MTYKELAFQLSLLNVEQQQQDVTVLVRGYDEFYPVKGKLQLADPKETILDPNHPYLVV